MMHLRCVDTKVDYIIRGNLYEAEPVSDRPGLYGFFDEDGEFLHLPLVSEDVTFIILDKEDRRPIRLFEILYQKDGGPARTYQIPARSAFDACVRLGQIYGDDKPTREDVAITVLSVN